MIASSALRIGRIPHTDLLMDAKDLFEQLLHARPLQHVLEMCHTVLEARQVEFKLPGSPLTPEEMRVRRREVIEEELTAGQKIIGDLEQLHQVRGRELFYALFGSWNVAYSWRGIDACQERMNAT